MSSAGALSPHLRQVLLRVAEAATPGGTVLGPPDERTVSAVEELVRHLPTAGAGYPALLQALDAAALTVAGARLSRLPLEARIQALAELNERDATHLLVRVVTTPIKLVRSDSAELRKRHGLRPLAAATGAGEPARWKEQMTDARTLGGDTELTADVVVVGTGAGGAPLAARLAARGHAVVLLEEGGYFSRQDFDGRPLSMQRKLYRDQGLTMATGNALIAVPVGRTVGGTTTINSGTCYRTPEDVLRRWQLENGLQELGPGSLDEHFDRVEQVLQIAESPPEILGGVARVIARGCDALGYAHGPLRRNAPGCDAQAVCCFGCPTDAKRSTNVSYVPMALERGAQLFHHARVDHVLLERGRAVGVEATVVPANGRRRRLVVRARAVVLACGALHTPVLLLRNGLANSSGQVGRRLTIHPASYAWARFAESIRGWEEVPQGYAVESFVHQGLRFEGGFIPLALAGATHGSVGPLWTELVESFDRIASFGFMLRETSRGRVLPGVGEPLVRYSLNETDQRSLVLGQAALARIYLAAGAEAVYPGLRRWGALRSGEDVERFEREAPAVLRPFHYDLSAFHPLGTCQMGADPARFVVGASHEAHDVAGLFVVDGSAVPGPLGVNPQVTLLALSERAAAFVERRLERAAGERSAAAVRRLAFAETMSGTLSLRGRATHAEFTVDAEVDLDLASGVLEKGRTFALEGTVTIAGLAERVPCQGSLRMRPLQGRANVVYDLAFTGSDARDYTLHGEKHAPLLAPTGMTQLRTELRCEGELAGTGLLRFELRDLGSWLRSFRIVGRPERARAR
ncbi:MAG: GMC family oxidoreductase [Polyangiaceae bacterium]|nr:GMC family oxidoreductase [Polyangiaceae bacterium]